MHFYTLDLNKTLMRQTFDPSSQFGLERGFLISENFKFDIEAMGACYNQLSNLAEEDTELSMQFNPSYFPVKTEEFTLAFEPEDDELSLSNEETGEILTQHELLEAKLGFEGISGKVYAHPDHTFTTTEVQITLN